MDRAEKVKRLSLKYKIFLTLTVFLSIFAVITIIFLSDYLTRVFREDMIKDGMTLAKTLSGRITEPLLIDDYVGIEKTFSDLKKANNEVSYLFIEKDGRVLLHTFTDGFPKGLLDIGHKAEDAGYILVRTEKGTFLDFSSPVMGGRLGSLRLGLTTEIQKKAVNTTVRIIIYITLAAFLLLAVLSFPLSWRLSRPLAEITRTAKRISQGDYSQRIENSGSDEIGTLSSAFNQMLDAIQIREKELRDINNELEEVNIKLYEYIEKLNRTRDELIKSRQDTAVVETTKSFLHHVRQPLTYLIGSIELLLDDLQQLEPLTSSQEVLSRLKAVEDAGERLGDLIKKFENLKSYKIVEYPDGIRILDIGE